MTTGFPTNAVREVSPPFIFVKVTSGIGVDGVALVSCHTTFHANSAMARLTTAPMAARRVRAKARDIATTAAAAHGQENPPCQTARMRQGSAAK